MFFLKDAYDSHIEDEHAIQEANEIGEYQYDRKVLFISSYAPTYASLPEQERGIYKVLKANHIGYEIEYLNAKELIHTNQELLFIEHLKTYLSYHHEHGGGFEGILVGDDNALHVIEKYQDEFFANLPIVFFAVNDIQYAQKMTLRPNIAGFIEPTYFKATIDLAKSLLPNAKQIIGIHDSSFTGEGDWSKLKNLQEFYPDLKFSDIDSSDYTNAEFEQKLQELPKDAIVLLLLGHTDIDGVVHTISERVAQIDKYASVPVFRYFTYGVGKGITGGHVMDMKNAGAEAAGLLVDILNKKVDVNDVPLRTKDLGVTLLDTKKLDEFGLDVPKDVPNLRLVNDNETVWSYYLPIIPGIVLIILGICCNLVAHILTERVKNKKLHKLTVDLQNSVNSLVDALGTAVEARDMETGGHIKRVKTYSEIVALDIQKNFPKYDLTDKKIYEIREASSLHDLGKLRIPDAILLKPGKLTPEEFAEMKKHSIYGADMVDDIKAAFNGDEAYQKIAYNIARYHHERFDGRGYPDGLKGNEIPIEAQIVALADVYDALTHDRPYKEAFPESVTYSMIKEGKCGNFNPNIMQAFDNVRRKMRAIT